MNLGPHASFIVGAYAAAIAIVAVLLAWVLIDRVRLAGTLAELEERGVTRRSEQKSVSAGENKPAERNAGAPSRRLIVLVPLLVFLAIAALFMYRLGVGDPSRIPSALIGHPAPATNLPPVVGLERGGQPVPGLDSAAFAGAVTVLNVWASWCIPCHDEAPLLMTLAADSRIRVIGINYKDQADNARRFLGRYGNPFAANGADLNGRGAIEWGVYGVPETFVIGRDAKIAYKLIGPITPDNLDKVLRLEIEKALARPANETQAERGPQSQ